MRLSVLRRGRKKKKFRTNRPNLVFLFSLTKKPSEFPPTTISIHVQRREGIFHCFADDNTIFLLPLWLCLCFKDSLTSRPEQRKRNSPFRFLSSHDRPKEGITNEYQTRSPKMV
mmetsp:Transcript_14145/g.29325  ORF Transcript_14145/g.29325 Transcript_14145/m.29325 type:complete len:114 (-) Transcript_14145:679-1020(-)